jgi:pyruvate,water dikinase
MIHICGEMDEGERASVGGKGRGVHLLWKCGAKVPDTVCIAASMEIGKAVEEVMRHFNDADGTREYAVRSSASIEDGQVRSFAGQFQSFLKIKGRASLEEHCRRIRNLGSSEHSHIRSYAGEDGRSLEMHILVQEMIDADFSGVLFTCDPVSGSRSHIVLEHVQGTSERLMDGAIAGERLIFHRDDFQSGCKPENPSQIEADPRSGEKPAPAGQKEASPVSANPVIDRLVREALELEMKLGESLGGGPLDYEWAVRNGEIIWLQVRPVTALRRRTSSVIAFIRDGEIPPTGPDDVHWTSINAREAIPMAITPLVRDLVVPFVELGFVSIARLFGDRGEYRAAAVFDGRVFLNVTDLKKLTSHFPVKNPEAIIESFLAGRSAEHADLKFSPSLGPLFLHLVWKELNLVNQTEAFMRNEEKSWRYPDPAILKDMPISEIRSKMKSYMEISGGFYLHCMGSLRYQNLYSLLDRICRKHGMSPSELVQGVGTPLFASSALRLRDLAVTLKGRESLIFDDSLKLREDWKERLDREPELEAFRKELGIYMEKFGHLGDGSLDIYLKSNREEPEKVMMLIAGIFRSGDAVSSGEYLKRLSAKRSQALQRLKAGLTFGEKIVFGIVLRLMHDSVHLRENVKFYFSRRSDIFKMFLMELAGRAAASGAIDTADDIFFMTFDEAVNLDPKAADAELKERIRERRQLHQRLQGLPYPLHRVEGPSGTRLYFPEKKEHGTVFRGAGASAGKAVGKARIILSLAEADRLNPGEILVTTATSPSWTPLFSIAGAVVVEIGSMLSHGAVVAREIGIPAVIGLPGIVESVHDGEILAVDGTLGTVEIVDSSG